MAAAKRQAKDQTSGEAKGESVVTGNSGPSSFVLELASGTGEHLQAFAATFDTTRWLGSERKYVRVGLRVLGTKDKAALISDLDLQIARSPQPPPRRTAYTSYASHCRITSWTLYGWTS